MALQVVKSRCAFDKYDFDATSPGYNAQGSDNYLGVFLFRYMQI